MKKKEIIYNHIIYDSKEEAENSIIKKHIANIGIASGQIIGTIPDYFGMAKMNIFSKSEKEFLKKYAHKSNNDTIQENKLLYSFNWQDILEDFYLNCSERIPFLRAVSNDGNQWDIFNKEIKNFDVFEFKLVKANEPHYYTRIEFTNKPVWKFHLTMRDAAYEVFENIKPENQPNPLD
jgi:hypothetical protein